MPTFDIEKKVINTFEIGDKYWFKQYLDQNDLFDQLKEYYNSDKYRFEVEEGDITKVDKILNDYFYELEKKENLDEYCVVQDITKESSEILRNAIAIQYHGGDAIYLMKDETSMRQAVEKETKPIKKSDVNIEDIEWKSR